MRAILSLVLMACVLASTPVLWATSSRAATWETRRFAELGFQADFPAAPTRVDKQAPTSGGLVPTTLVYVTDDGLFYFVSASDVSGTTPAGADLSGLSRGILDGMTNKHVVISPAAAINSPSGPGWEAVFESGDRVLRVRTLAVGPRGYAIIVGAPIAHRELLQTPAATRFLDSFRAPTAG
jgi:hypothetical protein